MEAPLVSIIIPVYKVEKYIIKCLASVVAQIYKNIEVILVDDASPDRSMEIVSAFLRERSVAMPLRILTQPVNRGLSEARNKAMQAAQGEYLFFIDSDDWLAPDAIQLLVASAQKYDSDVTIGQTLCVIEKDQSEKMVFPLRNTKESLATQDEVFEAFMAGAWPVIAPNKLYRLSFLKEYALTFESGLLGEDELWAFQWAQLATRVSFVSKVSYYYLLRGDSIIATRTEKNFEDMFFILGRIDGVHRNTANRRRGVMIQKYMLNFKEMILIMQWQSLSDKRTYLQNNYARLRQYAPLRLADFFSSDFTWKDKKKSVLLHLPAALGTRFFIWRYER